MCGVTPCHYFGYMCRNRYCDHGGGEGRCPYCGEYVPMAGTQPNEKRRRPMVTITLSPEALARLDEIRSARGQTRSGAIEQLIRNARIPDR